MRITAIVGNPRSRSKTYGVAEELAGQLAARLTADGETSDVELVDLADHGSSLLEWGHPGVGRIVRRVCESDVAVFVSPTYKATYTGLLKLFVDQLPMDALSGVTAIPVMVGAAPQHSLAVEAHLRPLLVEVGAVCPTRGLYVIDSQIDRLPETVGDWYETSARALRRAVLGKGA
ncbi:NADPH-dependent FMN reductase [Cohnella hongkongensis]|uniref:NADPH-dependent FMN reductase n=1 Tax=Cohnella hongkongensis TaxID=178337 RepID=A0ABV9FIK1_9BACL